MIATEDLEVQTALAAWASLVFTQRAIVAMPRATNPLWRVECSGVTFVLKQLPEYPVGVAPVVEFRVLSHLQGCGVRVALPVLTDAGTLHATVNRRDWILLPYLPHQPSTHETEPGAAAVAFTIGTAIGQLDQALARYPWPVESFVDDPTKILSDVLPQLPHEVIRLVDPFTAQMRDTCTDLPTQLTHGDCNDGNVLVDQGRVVGFIDIDHLSTGPRVRDLAYYLASRMRTHLNHPQAGEERTGAFAAVIGDYIAGYHHTYPLTERERRAVVPLMLLTEIGGAHWALHGWEPHHDHYQHHLKLIGRITNRFDELAEASHNRRTCEAESCEQHR